MNHYDSPFLDYVASILGTKLVAYMLGFTRTSELRSIRRADLVRVHQIAKIIMTLDEDPTTTRSWFMGMNPRLGVDADPAHDRAPAAVFREGDYKSVLAAARCGFEMGA